MRVFGNLMNRVHETIKPAIPEIGMGATILMFSDREPATITFIAPGGKLIGVKRDFAKRVDKNGMSESQTWEFSPNPDAVVEYYSLRKNGQWVKQGNSIKNGEVILLGHRSKYYDFSF